VTIKLMTRPED